MAQADRTNQERVLDWMKLISLWCVISQIGRQSLRLTCIPIHPATPAHRPLKLLFFIVAIPVLNL
jgi:hypothetical protein